MTEPTNLAAPRRSWLKQVFRRNPSPDPYGPPSTGSLPLLSVATVALLLVLWWVASAFRWVPPLFLPGPRQVWTTFRALSGQTLTGGTLAEHAGASLARVTGAFLLACVTAIPLGLSMGVNRFTRSVFDPVIEFYRPLPPLAYLPLTVIWFGIGETQKLVLLTLAIFAPLALSARAGVRSVAVEQVHAAYSMGASRRQVFLHVILPAALPEILTGMRIGLGFGWTTLVAAEMVAAQQGLGQMVLNASSFLRTDIMVVGIVVIGAIAYAFDLIMRWLEYKLVPWKGRG
jgi:taurine transport system permease protein